MIGARGAEGDPAATRTGAGGGTSGHGSERPLVNGRVVLLVVGAWLLAGLVWAAQASLAATLQGQDTTLAASIVNAMIQVVPWIPMTLAVVAITTRFPLDRARWRRSLPAHLLALPLVAWLANVLVVLGYWFVSGAYLGIAELVRGGAYWAAMRIHVMALVYAAVAALTQGLRARQTLRARELDLARQEGQLARARLQALTAQLRPHFLFNTLHTLAHLWRSGRTDEADGLLDRLGALFQRVQANTRELEVPLAEELALVRDYLAIEEARFRDRLRVTVEAGAGTEGCAVPPLILQPLVENAIRHGISARSSAGSVRVRALRRDGRLELVVEDDGPGPDAVSPAPGTGTGLSNTRERLHQMYGAEHTLEIGSPDEGGTRVRLVIPAREVTDG